MGEVPWRLMPTWIACGLDPAWYRWLCTASLESLTEAEARELVESLTYDPDRRCCSTDADRRFAIEWNAGLAGRLKLAVGLPPEKLGSLDDPPERKTYLGELKQLIDADCTSVYRDHHNAKVLHIYVEYEVDERCIGRWGPSMKIGLDWTAPDEPRLPEAGPRVVSMIGRHVRVVEPTPESAKAEKPARVVKPEPPVRRGRFLFLPESREDMKRLWDYAEPLDGSNVPCVLVYAGEPPSRHRQLASISVNEIPKERLGSLDDAADAGTFFGELSALFKKSYVNVHQPHEDCPFDRGDWAAQRVRAFVEEPDPDDETREIEDARTQQEVVRVLGELVERVRSRGGGGGK